MGDFVKRFTSFDKMLGTSVIKVLYFLVAGLIILATLASILSALGSMDSINGVAYALGKLVRAVIIGLLGILFWRFLCETFIIFFKISDDLAVIRARGDAADTGG